MRVILRAYNLKQGLAICRELDRNHEGEFLLLAQDPKKPWSDTWHKHENLEALRNAAIMMHSDPETVRPTMTYPSTSHIKVFLKNEWYRLFSSPETPDE